MLRILPSLVLLALLSGCETLGYYGQAARGQWELLQAREPIDQALGREDLDPELRSKLELVQSARRFATEQLQLPDNGSYRSYAPLPRDAVVYNVVAAPEFSLEPKSWCFWVVGCLSYRGYFAEADAQALATTLQAEGYDTLVGKVPAYSTLGWFADPVPGPVLAWPDEEIVRLLFHELAHQQLYIPDQTRYNENYANAVGRLGLRAWRQAQGLPAREDAPLSAEVSALLPPYLQELEALYARPLPELDKRWQKQAVFARLAAAAAPIRAQSAGWDRWFSQLSNARLAAFADYNAAWPAFAALHQQCQEDWACFHARSADIGENPESRKPLLQNASEEEGL